MKLKYVPVGERLLVRAFKPDEKTKGGIIIVGIKDEFQKGEVIAVGDKVTDVRLKPEAMVIFRADAGVPITANEEECLLFFESQIDLIYE